jgi:D-alanine-D-alanine ligase-like ATP-grasp enzyme
MAAAAASMRSRSFGESHSGGMDPAKYEKIEYFIDKRASGARKAILPEPGAHPEIDVVFPVLHGTFGEDGTMQGLFELADLPYVGAGVLGRRLHGQGDDETCLRSNGCCRLSTTSLAARTPNLEKRCAAMPFPMFVKPANLGSSVGISKAHNDARTGGGRRAGGAIRPQVIVERGIVGRELECAVLGNEARPLPCPARFCPRASSTITTTSTCWICRNQAAADLPRKIEPNCGAWRWNATARWNAKAWAASISCWKRPPASSTSTRSIPSRDSPRSACTRRCGSQRPLDRERQRKATRFTR